ncbi:MAG: sensor histidine kinase, partial [Acidobacteriota bacterium]
MTPWSPLAERVLVLAPTGRDAVLTCRILEDHGLECSPCQDVEGLDRELERGAGVVVLGEEALGPEAVGKLMARLEDQEVWSDLPVVLLARVSSDGEDLVDSLGARANVTVLDRPVRIATLLTTIHAALRARRQQYEVRDLVDQLAEQDRQKDEFLAVLGHELRNPLGAISTAAAVLSHDGLGDAPRRRQVAVIERQVRQLARMLDDLLDLSRLNLGKIRTERRPVELQAVVRDAVDTLDAAGQLAGRDVRVHLAAKPVTVVGDPVRLEQVVVNLLQNAVRHTPEGRRVEVSLERTRRNAVLRVKDEGVGLEPEELPAIFEPFRQLDGSEASGKGGFGVGLFLSRQLVELHGGRIEATSQGPGRGSVFTVSLPVAPRRVQAAGRAAAQPMRDVPRPETFPEARSAGPLRVLLVEDNEDD